MFYMSFHVDVNQKKSLRKSNKKPPKARCSMSTYYSVLTNSSNNMFSKSLTI